MSLGRHGQELVGRRASADAAAQELPGTSADSSSRGLGIAPSPSVYGAAAPHHAAALEEPAAVNGCGGPPGGRSRRGQVDA